MARPIRPEEKALLEHLLSFTKGRSYSIPEQVENLGDSGSIQLSGKGEHTEDLVEAHYRDADGRDVYITLSINQHGELYDLDIWKADFSSLKQYPAPAQVRLSE